MVSQKADLLDPPLESLADKLSTVSHAAKMIVSEVANVSLLAYLLANVLKRHPFDSKCIKEGMESQKRHLSFLFDAICLSRNILAVGDVEKVLNSANPNPVFFAGEWARSHVAACLRFGCERYVRIVNLARRGWLPAPKKILVVNLARRGWLLAPEEILEDEFQPLEVHEIAHVAVQYSRVVNLPHRGCGLGPKELPENEIEEAFRDLGKIDSEWIVLQIDCEIERALGDLHDDSKETHPDMPSVEYDQIAGTIVFQSETFCKVDPEACQLLQELLDSYPDWKGLTTDVRPQPKRVILKLPEPIQGIIETTPKGSRLNLSNV